MGCGLGPPAPSPPVFDIESVVTLYIDKPTKSVPREVQDLTEAIRMTTVAPMPVHPLVERGILRAYPRCPICGATERTAARRRRPMHDVYIEAAAANLGLPYLDLHEAMRVQRCSSCGSIWCDPWFSATGLGQLYGCGATQHLEGWDLFYRSLTEGGTPHRLAIWEALTERLGTIDTYGEMNCPFGGLLPMLRDFESGPRDKPREAAATIASIRGRHSFPHRRPSIVLRVWRRLRRIRRFSPRALDAPSAARVAGLLPGSSRVPRRAVGAAPPRRFLVFETSSAFWTSSCTSLGVTCRALAPTGVLNTAVLDWKDVDRESVRFDLFCYFNCLDHFLEPQAALRAGLECSSAVFIESHRSDEDETFSRQHLFALGPRALDSLLAPGWRWEDWTDRIGNDERNYYFAFRG